MTNHTTPLVAALTPTAETCKNIGEMNDGPAGNSFLNPKVLKVHESLRTEVLYGGRALEVIDSASLDSETRLMCGAQVGFKLSTSHVFKTNAPLAMLTPNRILTCGVFLYE